MIKILASPDFKYNNFNLNSLYLLKKTIVSS